MPQEPRRNAKAVEAEFSIGSVGLSSSGSYGCASMVKTFHKNRGSALLQQRQCHFVNHCEGLSPSDNCSRKLRYVLDGSIYGYNRKYYSVTSDEEQQEIFTYWSWSADMDDL
jgi:hypothetical protein